MRSDDSFLITGAQLRAARALLGITAQQLAARSGLGVATIRRAEAQDGRAQMTPANARLLRATLLSDGVELLGCDGSLEGVRRTGTPGSQPP